MRKWSMSCHPLKCLVMLTLVAAGCGSGESQVESVLVTGADEELVTLEQGLTGCVAAGVGLLTTSELNLRSGPATTYSILRTMPSHAVPKEAGGGCPTNGWYKLTFDGVTGWASGSYLAPQSASTAVRDQAIVRAQKGVGFSYWWGHGAYKIGADTGSCSGTCGSCTHTGSYGGDCSGYLAKVWVVPSTNNNLEVDSHPYSTIHFNVDSSQWRTIDRGSMLKADAMVYNSDGAGHTFVYESGDGWGNMVAYECKGCSYGCVYGTRTASSSYHAIRHF